MARYIFVTGGVVSSLGKGLTSAAVGLLLERRGLKIGIQKLDIWYWRRTGKEAVVSNAFGKLNSKVGRIDSKKRKMFDYALYCTLLVFLFLKLT